MHIVRLLLQTIAYDEQVIDKRFHAVSHIHNVLVKHAKKLLVQLKHHREYQILLCEYVALSKKEKLSQVEKFRQKSLSKAMSDIRISIGLSEYAFQFYIKKCAKQFSKCLSSQQVQKEATRVWKGVESVLFGNGKNIHFKKYEDFTTICGKTNTNGVKFDKNTLSIEWIGLNICCKHPKKDKDVSYLLESLDHNISYCEIERKMFPNGWHYYVLVYLKDNAPCKLKEIGTDTMGIDPGTSTVAGVSEKKVVLRELAPDCQKYNRQIQKLLRRMDLSRRAGNPRKYNPDGTINKHNHEKWVYSNTYVKNKRKLKSLYRQKSAYIKQSHEQLCNELLTDSVNFVIENMTYSSLQRRTKNTERSSVPTNIKQKDGSAKQVFKYKKKKRFGRSLNNRAPAMFLTILKRKCTECGGKYVEIDTKKFRASQYNHVTNEYSKIPLSQREKDVGGYSVQRDLYSAFLIRNSNNNLTAPDRDKCVYEFENFTRMQNELIEDMKKRNITMRQCFGF